MSPQHQYTNKIPLKHTHKSSCNRDETVCVCEFRYVFEIRQVTIHSQVAHSHSWRRKDTLRERDNCLIAAVPQALSHSFAWRNFNPRLHCTFLHVKPPTPLILYIQNLQNSDSKTKDTIQYPTSTWMSWETHLISGLLADNWSLSEAG